MITQETLAITKQAMIISDEMKGEHIVAYDVSNISAFNESVVLVDANNERLVQAIAERLSEALPTRLAQARLRSSEGYEQAHWILLDFGSVIVHVMSDTARAFYDLERLWGDMPQISL